MKLGLLERWKSWRDIDAGRASNADSREATLDAILRAGAAHQTQEEGGRLRWRVLGAVSAQRSVASDAEPIVGRLGWRWAAVAACAIVAVVGGAVWINPKTPQTKETNLSVQPTPTIESSTPSVSAISAGWAFLQSPMTALAARIDQPFEREAERLVADTKKVVSFFAKRVTTPISSLHRAGSDPQKSIPKVDESSTGGA